MTGVDPAQLVFLDETSTPTTLTPVRARAARGQRADGRIPRGRREAISWLATLTPTGLGESLVVRGAVDRLVFEAFVERGLVPTLRPGQIVILDNLSVHKSANARALIEAAGCRSGLLADLCARLQPDRARVCQDQAARASGRGTLRETVIAAVGDALATITAADARAFFADAGFPVR